MSLFYIDISLLFVKYLPLKFWFLCVGLWFFHLDLFVSFHLGGKVSGVGERSSPVYI